MRRSAAVVGLLAAAATSCIAPSVETIGPRTTTGVVRLSEDEFGLLVYPCVADLRVSEIELVDIELDADSGRVVDSRVLIRERYSEPSVPAELVVSTALNAPPAAEGAERDVINPVLLERFNDDSDYLTAIDVNHFLAIQVVGPDGADIGGGGKLTERFDLEVGEVMGSGFGPAPLGDVRCTGEDAPAWDISVP